MRLVRSFLALALAIPVLFGAPRRHLLAAPPVIYSFSAEVLKPFGGLPQLGKDPKIFESDLPMRIMFCGPLVPKGGFGQPENLCYVIARATDNQTCSQVLDLLNNELRRGSRAGAYLCSFSPLPLVARAHPD